MANDDARFVCHSLCTIRPMSVTWYGNDASLDIDNIKYILAIDNSLIISHVKSSDATMYSCRSSGETIAMFKLVVILPTTTTTTTTTTTPSIYTKTVDKEEVEPSVSVTANTVDKEEDEPSVSVTAKTADKDEGEPSGSVTSKTADKDENQPSDCVTSKIVDKDEDEPSDSASVITIAAVVAGVTVFSIVAVVFLYLYVSGRSSTSQPANHVASTSDSQQSPTLADQAIEYVSSAITSGPADQVDSTHTSVPPDNVASGSIHSAATGP